jgi:hypothetical protein
MGSYYQSYRGSKNTLKSLDGYFFFLVLFFFDDDLALVDFAFEGLLVPLELEALDLDLVALAVVFFLLVVFFAADLALVDFAFELFDLLAAFLLLDLAFAIPSSFKKLIKFIFIVINIFIICNSFFSK